MEAVDGADRHGGGAGRIAVVEGPQAPEGQSVKTERGIE